MKITNYVNLEDEKTEVDFVIQDCEESIDYITVRYKSEVIGIDILKTSIPDFIEVLKRFS